MEKEKSPTRRSGAAETRLFCVKLATHQPDFGSHRPSEAVGHLRRPTQVGVFRTVVSLRHLFTPIQHVESAAGGQRKSAQAITLIVD